MAAHPPESARAPRRCLLVGGSDGIGLAVAKRLLAEGWSVVGVSRSPVGDLGPRYEHAVLDVRAPEYRAALAALCEGRGPFDVCVYSAGTGDLLEVDALAAQRAAFEVNLLGAVDTAQVVVAPWLRAGRGHFVVLSSLADALVGPASPGYNASKAAVSSYFESLALALRPRGVAVTNLRFGFVDTKMAKAPVRPFMITREEAAGVVLQCLATRPLRRSHPWPMVALLWLVGLAMRLRVWWG
jgi:NAD(P)-dependent dehydrogenase (short-subunit alcohol dehydrogenase family)